MTTQYIRYYSVACSGSGGGQTFTDPGDPNNPQLRCRFEIHRRSMQSPGEAIVKITNPLRDHAMQFVRNEYTNITIDAGYVDGHALIFQGNIKQGVYGRENPTDTLLQVLAADGDHAHSYATVNTTLPPGSTPQQHFNVAAQAMAKYGIGVGFIGVDLSTPTYNRAVTLWGMARDVLANIAKFKKASVSYQKEKITIIPKSTSGQGGMVLLNSQTGLIGMPTQTLDGIYARCLINPAIDINVKVQIDQKDIAQSLQQAQGLTGVFNIPAEAKLATIAADGIYVVRMMDIYGDSRGNPWYMDLTLTVPGGPTTLGEIGAVESSSLNPPYVGPF